MQKFEFAMQKNLLGITVFKIKMYVILFFKMSAHVVLKLVVKNKLEF